MRKKKETTIFLFLLNDRKSFFRAISILRKTGYILCIASKPDILLKLFYFFCQCKIIFLGIDNQTIDKPPVFSL